jgi:antiviral helicase SKI2
MGNFFLVPRCLSVPKQTRQYEIVHGEKVLKQNLAELRLAISEQNLELIPDYEQRVEVLKELRFIDENSTVLLKGRVACEVSLSVFRGTGYHTQTLDVLDQLC